MAINQETSEPGKPISDMSIKRGLKECLVFSALSDAELERVASSVLEKRYEAGSVLFHEGDKAEELLVLLEGKVAVQMSLPGAEPGQSRRITVDVVGANEAVGWSAIVEPNIYTFTGVCLQSVKALSVSGPKLRWLLNNDAKIGYEVYRGLIKVVASRLDDTRRVLVSERSLLSRH
ncbi:MAG: cyclic nucleotide-binding domain-containing protein [Chloroflexi bacterium]|nr:cyclic nucleotide-binding domain-containing protein [Chloroflexota bacterium]